MLRVGWGGGRVPRVSREGRSQWLPLQTKRQVTATMATAPAGKRLGGRSHRRWGEGLKGDSCLQAREEGSLRTQVVKKSCSGEKRKMLVNQKPLPSHSEACIGSWWGSGVTWQTVLRGRLTYINSSSSKEDCKSIM